MSEMNNIMEEDQTPTEEETMTIEEAKPNPGEDGPKLESITTIMDDLGNKIKVPEGFHLDQDSGTKVEEGIVIEDDNGNQFVWIPVGEYNVSTSINSSGKLTNELTRRTFTSTGSTPVSGDDVIETYYYGEGDSRSVAKDQIEAFKTSSNTNKGFYIGRYEQGEGNVCKAGIDPYINITRDEAKAQAEAMYNGNEFITSQLISSYAWDTALNFICQTNGEGYLLATTTNSSYANIGTNNKTKTGEYSADNYSNIHDFLGNRSEWTTEYSSYTDTTGTGTLVNCSIRGGLCAGGTGSHAANRGNSSLTYNGESYYSFRVQLYIK